MVKESEYDSQPDDSVSAQKQPIETNDIADDAITSPKIKDGEVKTSDIGDSAVTKQKFNPMQEKLVVVEQSNTFEVPANDAAEGNR